MVRAWLAKRRLERLPVISVTTVANYHQAWTSPNPDLTATAWNGNGDTVGTIGYQLSPLGDKVYVFRIDVPEARRRRGYGLALLRHLASTYELPMTAVMELWSAKSFWNAARKLAAPGFLVTPDLATGDMDAEASSWSHLQPDKDRLQELIRHRLEVLCEPWHIAVGRGLDDRVNPMACSVSAYRSL